MQVRFQHDLNGILQHKHTLETPWRHLGDTLETLFCEMISVFTLIPSAPFDPQNVSSLISDRAWDWCDSREDAWYHKDRKKLLCLCAFLYMFHHFKFQSISYVSIFFGVTAQVFTGWTYWGARLCIWVTCDCLRGQFGVEMLQKDGKGTRKFWGAVFSIQTLRIFPLT